MTNREKFTEIFGYEIVQRDTGEAIPGHCKILIASDKHFNEWLKQEYVPSAQLAQDLPKGCTDTISRAAVGDALNGIEISRNASWYEFYQKALTAVGELPSAQPGWIPVTKKCPEIGQIVLCSLKTRHYYGRIHVCKYCAADKYYDHPYFDWSHNGFPNVVAWMPLPQPWEGEKP